MRKIIILTSGVAAALVLGVTVVDAQRPRAADRPDRPAVAQRGDRGPAFAQGGRFGRFARGGPGLQGRRGGGPAFGGILGAARGLELTDDQRASIEDVARGTRDQAAPIADELQVARRALHRAVFADTRDETAVNELAAQVASLEQQLAAIHLKAELATADVLTADQKAIVRTRPQRGPGGRGRGR